MNAFEAPLEPVIAYGRSKEIFGMEPIRPVNVIDLFPVERDRLLQLFAGLSVDDWNKSTVCEGWSVKDIGLHLLGDDLGYLSRNRDNFIDPSSKSIPAGDWATLVKRLNTLNQAWVESTRRLSPPLLISLLALTGNELGEFVRSLDMNHIGGPVSWAGPEPAPVWLDVAREYSERWLHQQQIRDAVHKPGAKERDLFHPVLDTLMRALPHTYREVTYPDQTVVKVLVSGQAGGEWFLQRGPDKWSIYQQVETLPSTTVILDQETCWRLFTKGLSKQDARQRVSIDGDVTLGERVLDTVSIIA